MIIIVDAYNVLKQMLSGEVTEHERNQFIAQFGRYARRKKHKLILVFDGGSYEWPHKIRQNGIYVIYSGIHQTADDYIADYLALHKNSDVLLVSSDHEINVIASRLSIPSISSQDFYQLMKDALAKSGAQYKNDLKGEAKKTTERVSAELDKIMAEASQEVPIKSEDLAMVLKKRISGPPHKKHGKASKKERKLLEKLKKL